MGGVRVIDVLLALLAVLAIAVPVVSLVAKDPPSPSGRGPGQRVRLARRPARPDPARDPPLDGADLRIGAWLGLAGAVIAWVGSWLSLRDESTPGAVAPTCRSARPA